MKKLWLTLMILSAVLAGCMKKEENTSPATSEKNDKIVVEDAYGKHDFEGPQQKIVALEWSLAEELLAVGVQPTGVADIENFNKWVTIDATLADDVVDVGQRTEPNIEEIAKLQPDVILGMKGRHEKVKAELEKIAPVLLYDSATPEAQKDLYAHMINTLTQNATLVGKQQEAKEAIAKLEARITTAKDKLKDVDLPTKNFVFTQAFSVNEAPTFRIFTPNAIVSHVLEGMGLTNRIQDQADASGLVETNVEGLSAYQDALLIYTVQEDDPLFKNLANNQAWNNFDFVKKEALYDAGAGVWTFGSVLSMETLVDQVEKALVQ